MGNWTYDILSKGTNDYTHQVQILRKKKLECIGHHLADKTFDNKTYRNQCPRKWDGVMCWPPTDAGTLGLQPCPSYIVGFDPHQNATRNCTSDGTWRFYEDKNSTWSNYSACKRSNFGNAPETVPRYFAGLIRDMRVMYNIGYGLSLVSLILAVIIMLYFKRVHCARNTIHLNLFISFILRAAVSFVRENLMVDSVGFPSDVISKDDGSIVFKNGTSHWECRLFFTMTNYIIAASYMWIFVEALYLQMLISVAVFSEKNRLNWYMIFGWTMPLVIVLPWVVVRITVDNEYCWNTHYQMPWVIWVIFGPITLSIIINVCIFVNIVRILFTKLNSSPCPETKKFRRLAKSTLILIPLFGVYYIVFIYVNIGNIRDKTTIILLYIEMFFNSFQGFLLSMLFCFFNSEIQAEFKKLWKRRKLQRNGNKSSIRTKVSFMSRGKSGRAGSRNLDIANGTALCMQNKRLSLDPGLSTTKDGELTPLSNFSNEIKEENSYNSGMIKDTKIDEVTPCLNNNHSVDQVSPNNIDCDTTDRNER